jgi:hypothetical protein
MPTDIRRQAIEYGEFLAATLARHPGIVSGKMEGPGSASMLAWRNPENIDTGYSGLLLLLIELYEQTREPRYLATITSSIDKLLVWCRENETTNYSLYAGRAGVVYILLRWYLITKDKELPTHCLELIRNANREYLHSKYTSNYLFDGRAGTLLVIIHLYGITQEPFLLEYINEFVHRILFQSQLLRAGICWASEEEINLGPSPGFAYGAAGIRYVLGHLDNYTRSADLRFVLAEADRFIAANFDKQTQIGDNPRREILNNATLQQYRHEWQKGNSKTRLPDHGWAEGSTGILFQSLQNTRLPATCAGDCNCGLVSKEHFRSNDLHSGLSGWSMYMLEKKCGNKKNTLLQHLAFSMHNGELNKNIDGGLLRGEAGLACFLLRATGNMQPDNILVPFLRFPMPARNEIDILIDRAAIKRNWLGRYYPRTIHLLQTIDNTGLTGYLETLPDSLCGELVRFGHFVKGLHLPPGKIGQLQCLLDLYELEKEKASFVLTHEISPFEMMMQEWKTRQEALEHLDKAESWLLDLQLSLSPHVKVLTSKWDWSFADDFDRIREDLSDNFKQQPSAFEYVVQVSRRGIVETPLKADSLLLHLFDKPARVHNVLSAIRQYVSTLSHETIQKMLNSNTGNSNMPELIEHLDEVALFRIRQWIYCGILTVNT